MHSHALKTGDQMTVRVRPQLAVSQGWSPMGVCFHEWYAAPGVLVGGEEGEPCAVGDEWREECAPLAAALGGAPAPLARHDATA